MQEKYINMKFSLQDTVGEIVTKDYRTAAIFKAEGIDYCCRGKRTLNEVLTEKGIEPPKMLRDLDKVTTVKSSINHSFAQWPLDLLVDYIEKKHHRYVKAQLPLLTGYLKQIEKSHGKTHPGIQEILDLFHQDAEELSKHMEEEETMLFPVIRNLVAAPQDRDPNVCIPSSLLEHIVGLMMHEHVIEGNRWRKINELAQELGLSCNVAFVTFELLREFEEDLHEHIHLENNLLFPTAVRLMKEKNLGSMSNCN